MDNDSFGARAAKRAMSEIEDKALLAEIAHKSDVAARNRKLRAFGFEAVDVYAEVLKDLLERLVTSQTLQTVWNELLEGRIEEVSPSEAQSLAIGILCARAAERTVYRARLERPVGDATTVVGEEVPTEQRELSETEAANGGDRQMKAVLARKAMHRGIHRADVYGVADASRGYMKDNCVRFFAERDEEVIRALWDANWTPQSEAQQTAWIAAFQGDSVADVLFGIIPNIDAYRAVLANRLMRAFGLFPTTDAHQREVTETDEGDANTYPTRYPYKPLVLATTRTKRPIGATEAEKCNCIHCAQIDPNGTFQANWRRVHNKVEAARKAADPTYVVKPYKPLTTGKNCPWGKTLQWRSVSLKGLLPQSDSNASNMALRRAMVNFAQIIREGTNGYWKGYSEQMTAIANYRTYLEDRDGVGHGTPKPLIAAKLPEWTNRTLRNIWPEEAATGKEGRRFALPLFGANGEPLPGMADVTPFGAFTIDLANPTKTGSMPLPGTERLEGYYEDMMLGPVMVSKTGNMVIDGVQGTFVFGLRELHEWNENLRNGRKFVKALVALRGIISLSLAGN